MKRFLALALVLALACATAVTGFAADNETEDKENKIEPSAGVEYTGNSLVFNDGNGNETTAPKMTMSAMLPGVPSEGAMLLENTSGSLANIYVDTSVVQTLVGAAGTTNSTGYTVKLWVEQGGNTTVLFGSDLEENKGSQVGGAEQTAEGTLENQELKALNDMLAAQGGDASTQAEGNNYLLAATLKNGETATLRLSITPDPTATTSTYMAGNGEIQFKFMAEQVDIQSRTETRTVKGETTIVTQTRYWLNGVQTGDPVAIAPLVAILVLAVLVFLIAAKKKKKKEE